MNCDSLPVTMDNATIASLVCRISVRKLEMIVSAP